MVTNRRIAAARRDRMAAERVPCSAHITPSIATTHAGDYLQAFRLGGVSFDCTEDDLLNTWHERLNVLWRNIASPDVSLWSHVIRRRAELAADGSANGGFSEALAARYRARLVAEALMVNELYLAVVYRPGPAAAGGLLGRVATGITGSDVAWQRESAIEACEKLSRTLQAALAGYEPEILGCYEHHGRRCSTLLEYVALLVNGEWQRMPVIRAPLNANVVTTRILFGAEVIEYRTPTGTRLGAMLGMKEYPTASVVGMFNRLLTAGFPLILTQSFTFLAKATGQRLLQRQITRMANAGDYAVSQADDLGQALDALTSNHFVMGDHHLSLQIMADGADPSGGTGGEGLFRALNENVAVARSLLADTGMTVAREDLALEAAFWAQLPGNFSLRPRKAPISSRNYAAMVPFHNYPAGRARGNHWGDALAVLKTSARSAFHFSLHASDAHDPGPCNVRDTGHTVICGPTGSGKSVLIGFLVSMLARRGVTQILFDKDHGLEGLVRVLGGAYLKLRSGAPTGFNPLQLPGTPENVEFLKRWLRTLVRLPGGAAPSAPELADLDQALKGTLALDIRSRRLSRLAEFLDSTRADGVFARLAPWCDGGAGGYGWAFDNSEDMIVPRLDERTVLGFDMTDILDHEQLRPPVTLYLFHLVRQLLDGRRLVCWMDEFWRLIADPAFEAFAKDGPKTWRKLNGVMCLATQSTGDVLESPISRTIVEQTPTKVFFPNVNAVGAEYMGGFGLTEREFQLIKYRLLPGSRCFLLKQGRTSMVCQLDLGGFDKELSVLAGAATRAVDAAEPPAQTVESTVRKSGSA